MNKWFRDALADATAEVASWPEWKRREGEALFADLGSPEWTCVHRARCREAQSCNGKPCSAQSET
jgi:hypothetical protein